MWIQLPTDPRDRGGPVTPGRFLSVLLPLLLPASALGAVVEHSGTISALTTWSADDVHVITGNITVANGVILTIEPGALVKVQNGGIYIDGAIVAVGSEADPIVFTSWEDDTVGGDTNGDGYSEGTWAQWSGIQFRDASLDAVNQVSHVEVRYAGAWTAAVAFHRANPTVDHLTVRDSYQHGIYTDNASPVLEDIHVEGSRYTGINNWYGNPTYRRLTSTGNGDHGVYTRGGTPVFDEVTLTDNEDWGLYFYEANASPVLRNSVITGNRLLAHIPVTMVPDASDGNVFAPNDRNVLYVRGRTRSEDLHLQVLPGGDGAEVRQYVFSGTTNLDGTTALTVDPGVVVKGNGGSIDVRGVASILGTAEEPVVFTSHLDDGEGGDVGFDGYATSSAANQWGNLHLYGHGSVIRHARFAYGGNGDNATLRVRGDTTIGDTVVEGSYRYGLLVTSGTVAATRLEVRGNTWDGIRVEGGTLDLTDSRVYANGDEGIEFSSSGTGTLSNNEIFANADYGAYSASSDITATGNWWGAADGPSGTFSGSGDAINERIDLTFMGLTDDYLSEGSAYSYLDAGEQRTEGTFAGPTLLQGTPSTAYGSLAYEGLLFDLDRVSTNWVVDPTLQWQLYVAERIHDAAASGRVNSQSLWADGVELREDLPVPSGSFRPAAYPLPLAETADGAVQLDVRVGDGPRASVQELMLLETPRADQVAPIVTLDLAPGQRVAPDAPITGTVTDDVGVRRVEIGVVEGSEVTWHPARELRTTGVFTWSHDGGTELVTLRARAFDHAGNLAESADVAV
jgi:hypothetical protein